ncbi:MAG: hypothetical protein HWN51_00850 [Desulfobacterales bacterium]|nr:hypothetical protein [Desulfobacterales bacterium]
MALTYEGLGRKAESQAGRRKSLDIIEKHLEMNPDDVRALYLGAVHLVQLAEQERGLEWAKQALSIDSEDALILYNVACVYSLSGEIEKAIDCLEKALKAGMAHKEWIENDPDLDPLRSHPRFQELTAQMK